jgi:peptidoglycan/xylan/chitin deacetylase (PgdA/CDA1 family)
LQKRIGKQVTGKIKIPEGKSIAVNFSFDFDACSVWYSYGFRTQEAMARGEFGAEVGVPRILDLLYKYKIKATFFIPGHTADTFPDISKEIAKQGHEVGHHGYAHEAVSKLSAVEEEKVMNMGLDALNRIGVKPHGYRSPSWDYSPQTLQLIEKYGFIYDSSLMANDLYPYRPRYCEVHLDRANIFGSPSKVIEIPCSWFLDDFPTTEFIRGIRVGMCPVGQLYNRWTSIFNYAVANCPESVFVLTNHPQTIGRAHMIQLLEQMIQHVVSNDGWITTLDSIARAYEENS